jgi:hypothetical protein
VRTGPVLGAAACVALALAPAAQLRMDAELLERWPVFALFVLALAALSFGLLRVCAPREHRGAPRLLVQAYASLFALVAAPSAPRTRATSCAGTCSRTTACSARRCTGSTRASLVAERDGLWARQRPAQPPRKPAAPRRRRCCSRARRTSCSCCSIRCAPTPWRATAARPT